MTVLGIPAIVILELVDVDIERAIGVEVHVSNEEVCDKPSIAPSFECSQD